MERVEINPLPIIKGENVMKYKYEYTVLNIYTGNYGTLKSNRYYAKGEIINDEYEPRDCLINLENGRKICGYY